MGISWYKHPSMPNNICLLFDDLREGNNRCSKVQQATVTPPWPQLKHRDTIFQAISLANGCTCTQTSHPSQTSNAIVKVSCRARQLADKFSQAERMPVRLSLVYNMVMLPQGQITGLHET